MSYEEEDTWRALQSYQLPYNQAHPQTNSFEEEDTCLSYEEEDTWRV
jgi:hypothetical protein